jgi:2-phosphoglycerate kinase
MRDEQAALPWSVLLIGGSSGCGKTIAASQIAREFGIPHLQVDDFRLALQRATTPEQHPALHFFLATGDIWRLPPELLAERLADVGRIMSHALEVVLAHHVDLDAPVVLEGDGLLPHLAVQLEIADVPTAGWIRAVFIHEPDEAALHEAMFARQRGYDRASPEEQRTQVRMSWLYGNWLRDEAERRGLPIVAARPWGTLPARMLATVAGKA